ncbi:MAG: hypothetical protein WC369_00195 [Dehalococcoidales bacterium]|jgi:glutaredoxin 2
MGPALNDIKRFIESMSALNKEVVEGFNQLKTYENQIRTGRYTAKQLPEMKVLEFIQRARAKKLQKLQTEFTDRFEKEKWAQIPGFDEYIISVKDKFLVGGI